jgi:hypothetical protein
MTAITEVLVPLMSWIRMLTSVPFGKPAVTPVMKSLLAAIDPTRPMVGALLVAPRVVVMVVFSGCCKGSVPDQANINT